ncbi:MAG TPA: carboxymuconolactone decarboxylase family protein [Blastocatellia bacterium]|nr:carboxymuconolactone decarboxylase family protein [Blastocatellia bacterium]
MHPTEPRIKPLPEPQWDDETRELLEGLRRDGRVFNIFSTLARHPKLLKRWLVFAGHILGRSSLPAREREIAILRMAWLSGAEYEWGHHAAIGKDAGLGADEVRRITEGPAAKGWDAFDATILRAVDELNSNTALSDSTWSLLEERYNTEQLIDFVFTVGQYKLVSMALNSLGVRLEEGFEGFPR